MVVTQKMLYLYFQRKCFRESLIENVAVFDYSRMIGRHFISCIGVTMPDSMGVGGICSGMGPSHRD